LLRGFTRKHKALELLMQGQVEELHRVTLDILREAGVT